MVAAFLAAPARGEEAIHAGACAHAGGGWVFLGGHEQGKSTLLALLAALGCEPPTDDMAVIRDGKVCAGARCLDLRPSAAAYLGVGKPARLDTRSRVSLPPVQAGHPLRGFLHLSWSSRMRLRRLPARERRMRLTEPIGYLGRLAPGRLLEYAALRHSELSRPRDWHSAEYGAQLVQRRWPKAATSDERRAP